MAQSSPHILENGILLPNDVLKNVKETRLALLKIAQEKPYALLRKANTNSTKRGVSESATDDALAILAVNYIEDLDKVLNTLANRIRDWYALPHPEYASEVEDNREFIDGVLSSAKKPEETFGASLSDVHFSSLRARTQHLHALYKERDSVLLYIEDVMKTLCPNVLAITGALLGAKLLAHAGSMKRLAILPASTIQLLGAEKALFRHLRMGARPPKYGVLLSHGLVQGAHPRRQGRAARILADKVSIAARIDFFKGEFRGDMLLSDAKKKIEAMR